MAALGACILAEDTLEHREILGPDGDAVVYFRSLDEMLLKARRLIEDGAMRARLSVAAKRRIRVSANTYHARLDHILKACDVLDCQTRPSTPFFGQRT